MKWVDLHLTDLLLLSLSLCLMLPRTLFFSQKQKLLDRMYGRTRPKVDAIDSSTPAGRERLKKIVATLLNSYLAQLLESGFLHADPHP